MHFVVVSRKDNIPYQWVDLSKFRRISILPIYGNLEDPDKIEGYEVFGLIEEGNAVRIIKFDTRREAEIWCNDNIPVR